MNELQIEALNRLDAVAAKLNIAAEHLWEVFVRQATLEGVVQLSGNCVVAAISILALVILIHRYCYSDTKKSEYRNKDAEATAICAAIVASLVSLLILIGSFSCYITKIFNPDYHAWLEIKDMLQ